MFPFNRIQYNAPVILSFSIISLMVLGLSSFTNGVSNWLLFTVYRASFTDPLFYIRLFTHVLGHANTNHFISNFILVLLVGPMLEEKYGSKAILIMMVVTAFVTGVLHLIMSEHAQLGASGIVFTFMLLASFTNMTRGKIPLTLLLAVGVFLGREVISSMSNEQSNVAYMAHIVGGLCGAAFGFIANRNVRDSRRRIHY